jgi:hypothetical protein
VLWGALGRICNGHPASVVVENQRLPNIKISNTSGPSSFGPVGRRFDNPVPRRVGRRRFGSAPAKRRTSGLAAKTATLRGLKLGRRRRTRAAPNVNYRRLPGQLAGPPRPYACETQAYFNLTECGRQKRLCVMLDGSGGIRSTPANKNDVDRAAKG